MGMYENLNDIVKTLYHDETLLRLLYYPPTNYKDIPDPLDTSLKNVLDIDTEWLIRDDRIMSVPKSDDLVDKQLGRVYVYAGRRRPQGNNFMVANQEVVVDIICHNAFEKDLRSLRVGDRINEILALERVTGMGKIEYVSGNQISVPNNYTGYRHTYEFVVSKK